MQNYLQLENSSCNKFVVFARWHHHFRRRFEIFDRF